MKYDILFIAISLAMCLLIAPLAVAQTAPIFRSDDRGWLAVRPAYQARFSPTGALISLRVNSHEFLAPLDAAGACTVVNGNETLAFASAAIEGDTLVATHANATVRFRPLEDRLEIYVKKRGIPDGQIVRLFLANAIARAKHPVSSDEIPMPLKQGPGPARLIAANGAALTVPASSLASKEAALVATLNWVSNVEALFTIGIAPTLPVEDRIRAQVKLPTEDGVCWSDKPARLEATVTAMTPGEPFKGEVVLRLREYVMKTVARELAQKVDLAAGASMSMKWTIEGLAPALYIAEIWAEKEGKRGIVCAPRIVFNASAMTAPAAPLDFDQFWSDTLAEQAKIPADFKVVSTRQDGKSEIIKFSFAGLMGQRCHGFLTVPIDKSARHPAVLVLPSSGLRSFTPRRYPDGDAVAMVISINTQDIDLPEEQYDWATWPAPYLSVGITDRERYLLRYSYAALVRSAELLAARPEVQPDNMLCYGSSQGGGMTLVAAGLYPKFKAAVSNVPGLLRLDWNMEHIKPPYFPIPYTADNRHAVRRTLSYYDATNFARRIKCPIWMSMGLMDDVTPAAGVFGAFNAIPAQRKSLLVEPWGGHGGGVTVESAAGVWP